MGLDLERHLARHNALQVAKAAALAPSAAGGWFLSFWAVRIFAVTGFPGLMLADCVGFRPLLGMGALARDWTLCPARRGLHLGASPP